MASLTIRVEGVVSEAWMLELIAYVRDAARDGKMSRLAEHLDDAILIAASEFHDTDARIGMAGRHDGSGAEALRDLARHGLH